MWEGIDSCVVLQPRKAKTFAYDVHDCIYTVFRRCRHACARAALKPCIDICARYAANIGKRIVVPVLETKMANQPRVADQETIEEEEDDDIEEPSQQEQEDSQQGQVIVIRRLQWQVEYIAFCNEEFKRICTSVCENVCKQMCTRSCKMPCARKSSQVYAMRMVLRLRRCVEKCVQECASACMLSLHKLADQWINRPDFILN